MSEPVKHSATTAKGVPASLDMRFLRRTGAATVATILLVALAAAAYHDTGWALRYSLTGLWAVAFFALTALIFQNLLFSRNAARGILFTMLKVVSLGFIFAVNFYLWPVTDSEGKPLSGHTLALTLGLLTPFFVFVLRLVGFLMEVQKHGGSLTVMGMLPPASVSAAKNSGGRAE